MITTRLWKTAGLIALVGSGCQNQQENEPDQKSEAYYAARAKVINAYGDRNSDGLIKDEEITALMSDIAKVNGLEYKSWLGFVDRDGKVSSLEKETEMLRDYHPYK